MTQQPYLQSQEDCIETYNRFIKRIGELNGFDESQSLHHLITKEYSKECSEELIRKYLSDHFALNMKSRDDIINSYRKST